MKLIYIANIRLPTEKAHGIQIMKMCEAFASSGAEVELLVPNRKNNILADPFAFYDVKPIFSIRRLATIDFVRFGNWGFRVQSLTFAISVLFTMLFSQDPNRVLYSRDELPLFLLSFFKKNLVWEAHMGHLNIFVRRLLRLKTKIIVITQLLRNFYVEKGARGDLVHVAPDGVDLGKFPTLMSQEEARKSLGLSETDKLVVYTGHLYEWKGVDVLAKSARYFRDSVKAVFVGGTEKHIWSFRQRYADVLNIKIVGRKSYNEIPLYLKAADLVVLPNSAKEDISRLYTSPMKLFEYMAAKRPIIASDLPSLREVIDDSTAFFFTPDDPKSLAEAVAYALDNENEAKLKAQNAFEKVQGYTWVIRAKKILSFI